MSESVCAVAADTKLETPEGPLTMRTVATTPCSVMTRTDAGPTRFHMTKAANKIAEAQPVLRIALANGRSFRVGAAQVLLKGGGGEVRAGDLQVGDELACVFDFPVGYRYRTDDGREVTARGTVVVAAVGPAGEADLYSFRVNQTGRFVFSAGVLGKAEGN